MQNALIVRNIKTLSKNADTNETKIGGKKGDYIPHSMVLKNKTLMSNGSTKEISLNGRDLDSERG